MRDAKLETFFWSRLQRLVEIRRDASEALGEGGLRLVDRCIYSMISDLRDLGVDDSSSLYRRVRRARSDKENM